MSTPCPVGNIDLILEQENIGDSLPKINNNFTKLKELTTSIRREINVTKNVRTLFYYGPNTPQVNDGTAGMNTWNPTRPSNNTIQNFVNSTININAFEYTNTGDVVYVVYQKTGWLKTTSTTNRTGTVTATGFSKQEQYWEAVRVRIGIGNYRTIYVLRTRTVYASNTAGWSASLTDTYNRYAPIFVIYRLTYNGSSYVVDPDYPKYSYATTGNSINWNNPENWTTY